MESMVMKLFRQLVDLGVFNKSWIPILSKKYLIGVFPGHLTVSRNDGPGVIGVHKSFDCTHLVTLRLDGSTEWWNGETFGEHELEQVLQAMIDVYPPELKEIAALGFSSMQWPNLPRLIEKLDTLTVSEALQALTEKGFFLVEQFPMITDDKQFAVFYSRTPQLISICKNDGDISQHTEPGMLGGVGGFTRICHLRGGNVIWSHEGYGTKHVENILNELVTKFIESQKVNPLDGLGRGLTAEASARLFKEQNPHMFPAVDRDAIALSHPGNTGYFFMMDADGNPVHSDGSPLSVNDGKGNLLLGGDAMAFMQKRIQAGLKPEPDDTTTPDWWAQLRALYPSTLFASEEERAEYIAKLRKNLPGLVNEDGSWDLMALSSKAQRKAVEDIRQWQVGPKGYIPRERFKDTEEYITHLERVIELSRMTPEEFAVDSKRSAEELSQMYPTPAELLNIPKNEWDEIEGIELRSQINADGHYIPHKDEPSPFRGLNWINWKRTQPDMVAYKCSFSDMRQQLLVILENEKPRSQVQRENVPDDQRTSDGHLSLGYVIHIRWAANKSWKEAHDYCVWLLSNNQTR